MSEKATLLAIITLSAIRGEKTPAKHELALAVRHNEQRAEEIVQELAAEGAFRIELFERGKREFVLPSGYRTRYYQPSNAAAGWPVVGVSDRVATGRLLAAIKRAHPERCAA